MLSLIGTKTSLQSNRQSKLQTLGNILREGLLQSGNLRRKHGLTIKANDSIVILLTDSSEGERVMDSTSVLRACRNAAREMETILFSTGGAERIVCTMRIFRDRPAMKELLHVKDAMVSNQLQSTDNLSLKSKEERMNSAIVNSLHSFLGLFNGRSGRRSNEDQNAYDAVMAALNNNDLTSAKLGRMLSRTLNVSHRQIKRGRALRQNMEDMDKKRWLRKSSAVPKNAIGEGTYISLLYSLKYYHSPFTHHLHTRYTFSVHNRPSGSIV